MGRTKSVISKRGLTPKEEAFVQEYLMDFDASRAAKAVGYAANCARTRGTKLLSNPKIQAALKVVMNKTAKENELTREKIIEQLKFCALRDFKDFVDEEGNLLPIRKMSKSARCAIDGYKQRTKTFVNDNGEEITTVETELKLVPKAAAIDMGMKHFGGYAAEKHEIKHSVDWDALYDDSSKHGDPLEEQITQIETLAITNNKPQSKKDAHENNR